MKRLPIAVVCLALAALAPAHADPVASNPKCGVAAPSDGTWQAPANDGLRVANLNVLHGLDDDPVADYPGAGTLTTRTTMQAEQLAVAGVDMIGMQEVSVFRDTATSPLREVAPEIAGALAEETDQRWWWCWYLANPYFTGEPDINDGGGGPISDFEAGLVSTFTGGPYAIFKEGVAVLSRYEIVDHEGLHLPPRLPVEIALCVVEGFPSFPDDPAAGPLCAATAGFERRSALWVRAATPEGLVDLTTTHLAHGITSASNASGLEQVTAALAFADARSSAEPPAHSFFTCDCNAEPGDDVPVIATIESLGWANSFTASCDPGSGSFAGCTAGPDVIVTHGSPSRVMFERLDYVFAREGTCTADLAPSDALLATTAQPYTDLHGADGWLYPSDHLGVRADVVAC